MRHHLLPSIRRWCTPTSRHDLLWLLIEKISRKVTDKTITCHHNHNWFEYVNNSWICMTLAIVMKIKSNGYLKLGFEERSAKSSSQFDKLKLIQDWQNLPHGWFWRLQALSTTAINLITDKFTNLVWYIRNPVTDYITLIFLQTFDQDFQLITH